MLVKLTPDDQLALPSQALEALGRPSHFDVTVEGGRLVLIPASDAQIVRDRLAADGITDQDVTDAVDWARGSK